MTLIGAALLMRAAVSGAATTTKYAPRAVPAGDAQPSERTLWDALDDGLDPTDSPPEAGRSPGSDSDSQGR